jgi:transposase InsO family protein
MIQQLYSQIQKQTDKHSVIELCDIYGVSRSGYYKWLKRDGKLNRYEKTHQKLDTIVSDIHAHHPMMGYRQIRDKLRLEFGWVVSDPAVWKSMKRLDISGYRRRRKVINTPGLEHIRYSNVLNREFTAEKPMEKIVTDVTYIKYRGKWYYLAGYLDLFNNEIVEWELSDTFDNFLVMRPAERLLKKKMSTEHQVLLHSDQGVQYSSAGYCNLLKEYNAIQSMSRAGCPHDNAVMESYWGRFKDTLRKHFRYWENDDLHSIIEQAIHYFNYERPVRKLNGKPPVLFRTELVA